MNKIAFMTLGCKVNQADTASMQELPKLQRRESDVVDKGQLEAEVKKLLGLG